MVGYIQSPLRGSQGLKPHFFLDPIHPAEAGCSPDHMADRYVCDLRHSETPLDGARGRLGAYK
jgi:hypothetical protein